MDSLSMTKQKSDHFTIVLDCRDGFNFRKIIQKPLETEMGKLSENSLKILLSVDENANLIPLSLVKKGEMF